MNEQKPAYAVLGASGGIGAAVTRALVADGRCVFAVTRSRRGLDELTDSVSNPSRIAGCVLDLALVEEGDAVVDSALEAFGRLDGLVNSAAVYVPSPATDLTAEQWDAVMGPNLRGALLVGSAVARHLAAQGRGRIVQVSSITAQVSRGDYTLYEASKAGLTAATRSMAVELAARGVTVNAVAPGWIRTPMSEELLAGVSPEAVSSLIPIGRVGEPDEIAEVITWLATRSPTFLTGQTIVVDGGQTAFTAHL
jgi:3-oxoacyl-[acyl-carrier protein] reductase